MRVLMIVAVTLGLCISMDAHAGRKLKVLFIGNSYTYVNDLPRITADVAKSMGDTLVYDSYTQGGYRLGNHFFDTLSIKKIKSGQWDYVVLQEQSQHPSREDNYFFNSSYTWARNLDTLIEAHNPCTKVMYYMTWGYKDGDSVMCSIYPTWPYVCTYAGMDSLTNLRYRYYADTALAATVTGWAPIVGKRNAEISPVGAVRRYIRQHYPGIELYWADKSHPSEAGSYAGACSFYTVLFRRDPLLIPYNYVLSAADAANIRTAARAVAYDSLSKWLINQEDVRAQFSQVITGGHYVSFTNSSVNATGYDWSFGDGGTSVAASPLHTYAAAGTYTVRLVATRAGCSDTTYTVLNVNTTGIVNTGSMQGEFTLAPNPANDWLEIHSRLFLAGRYSVCIRNMVGKVLYNEAVSSQDHNVDVGGFANGVYFISIADDKEIVFRSRFLKQ